MTTDTTTPVETPQKRLFKSPIRSWQYVFPDGSKAIFYNNMYCTEKEEEIAHFESEVRKGHPAILIDPKELYWDPSKYDPIANIRKQIAAEERAKVLEEIKRATNPMNDFGSYTQGPLNAQSSTGVAAVTAGGADARLVELANLQAKVQG